MRTEVAVELLYSLFNEGVGEVGEVEAVVKQKRNLLLQKCCKIGNCLWFVPLGDFREGTQKVSCFEDVVAGFLKSVYSKVFAACCACCKGFKAIPNNLKYVESVDGCLWSFVE